jgi:hypothetical protein
MRRAGTSTEDVDYESDSDASVGSANEDEREKSTLLLKVYEDAGPVSQRKLFGSRDDVFDGKVEGGENREWKTRYLALTGGDFRTEVV